MNCRNARVRPLVADYWLVADERGRRDRARTRRGHIHHRDRQRSIAPAAAVESRAASWQAGLGAAYVQKMAFNRTFSSVVHFITGELGIWQTNAERTNVVIVPRRNANEAPKPAERSDGNLLLLARDRLDVAFDVLVKRHQDRVLRFAFKCTTGNAALPVEAAQNIFVEIFH
jgi:hypothetical protein